MPRDFLYTIGCFAILFLFASFFFGNSLWKTVVVFAFIACEEEENNIDQRTEYPPTAAVDVVVTTDLYANVRYENQDA